MRHLVSILIIAQLLHGCSDGASSQHKHIMTYPVKNISISINSPKDSIYEFASNVANFPKWIAFVKTTSQQSEDRWFAETDLGQIEIAMTPKNMLGILDHSVKTQDGTVVQNALRVIANDKGSEVIFTLFRMPGKTEANFEKDANAVQGDLETLKRVMEQ